jgi:hypothetical protein
MYITLRERLFLGKFVASLQRTAMNGEQRLNLSILNKLVNPHLSFDQKEYGYLIKKLSDRFEEACDCRNEHEINLVQSLIVKLENSMKAHI